MDIVDSQVHLWAAESPTARGRPAARRRRRSPTRS